MARPRGSAAELSPWHRREMIIPPDSPRAWLELAMWELWMGVLLCTLVAFGTLLLVTARERIVIVEDLSHCYATTVVLPCERLIYRTGGLNAAFSVLCGALLLIAAAWLLWDLWNRAEPLPITDDFLKLLNDSFARNWRDPRTWPWSRLFYAYAFALVGAALTVTAGLGVSRVIADLRPEKTPIMRVNTSQQFRVP